LAKEVWTRETAVWLSLIILSFYLAFFQKINKAESAKDREMRLSSLPTHYSRCGYKFYCTPLDV
jgi:hypothetical protein